MKSKMRRCSCGVYTFQKICPVCGNDTKNPLPPRFSPADPYGGYRRQMKKKRCEGGNQHCSN